MVVEQNQESNLSESETTSLANYLVQSRNSAGIKVDQSAREAGISPIYLRKLESGEARNPSLRVAIGLSQTYGISLDNMAKRLQGDMLRETQSETRALEEKLSTGLTGDIRIFSARSQQLYLDFLRSRDSHVSF